MSQATLATEDLAKISEKLRAGLRGDLLRPGDTEYDQARKIHNGMIDRSPALIVRCADASDVIQAVNVAREHRILLSVLGGGHGVSGFAVCEQGLMIDLSRMKAIQVNPALSNHARITKRIEAPLKQFAVQTSAERQNASDHSNPVNTVFWSNRNG